MNVLKLWLVLAIVSLVVPIGLKLLGIISLSWVWLGISVFSFLLVWFIALLILVLYLVKAIAPES